VYHEWCLFDRSNCINLNGNTITTYKSSHLLNIYIKYFIYQIHYFDWLKIIDYIILIKVHIYEEREKHTLLNVGIIAAPKLYITLHIYLLLLLLYNQLFLTNQNNLYNI
jgi:hypothetical protein